MGLTRPRVTLLAHIGGVLLLSGLAWGGFQRHLEYGGGG